MELGQSAPERASEVDLVECDGWGGPAQRASVGLERVFFLPADIC